jgi:hypothetical protein
LEKEWVVVNEADLPWFGMFVVMYSVHQMKVPCPLERRNMGHFQSEDRLSVGKVSP